MKIEGQLFLQGDDVVQRLMKKTSPGEQVSWRIRGTVTNMGINSSQGLVYSNSYPGSSNSQPKANITVSIEEVDD